MTETTRYFHSSVVVETGINTSSSANYAMRFFLQINGQSEQR